jgi:hypothetical protein
MYESVFSGPIPVEIVEEIAPTPRGRCFRVVVSRTRYGYKKGFRMDANACDLWDTAKASSIARTVWSGKTWMDKLEAR